VKKGDTVKIVLTNANGMHDWIVDEFNAKTKVLQGTASDTIQFVASKTGTFEYYCGVGNHRQMGMVGKLIVE
jgi:nitrite reductase (NO-forming)